MRRTLRLIGWLLLVPAAYLLAGTIGGLIPANSGWRQTPGGVPVMIETNGVHTGIVLPAAGWEDLVRADHLPDPRHAGTHLSFGWGERRFYLETPTWADVTPGGVIGAATGSDRVLLHVDHVRDPGPETWRRVIRVSPEEHRRLVALIRARFAGGPDGRPRPIRGYGPADVFYESWGRYDAVITCNSWVGATLRAAGIRVGVWTPFDWTVMWWF